MLLHAVHALDHHVLGVDAAQHRAALALVAAGDHHHLVALLDALHQSTSGASETIFMKRSVRSSRVTGPKMRVPIGSSLAVSSTTALRVEAHQRAVAAAHALGGAHHDGVVDLALLDAAARRGVLDAHLDHVADRGIAALRAAQHLDAHDGARAGVVGDVQYGLHLNHGLLPPSNLRDAQASGSFGPRS